MELLPLNLSDKATFNLYLKKKPHILSNYSFENSFIWRGLFDVRWALINEKFCLFFKNEVGCFMNMPPLGGLDPETIKTCFEIMEDFNHNREISRIENIEPLDLVFFKEGNFRLYEKTQEYIVAQEDMGSLKGEKLKHKRSLYNFFIKNYKETFRNYEEKDRQDVLRLYEDWMRERMSKNSDSIYQAMLKDNFKALSEMLVHFGNLKFLAKVAECDRGIRGFISGFTLNPGLFCINFEIADLKFQGLAQFIFC